MIRFDVLTLFPAMISSYINESILKRAQEKKIIAIHTHNIREYTTDSHRTTDDAPYGGGPGMVMKVEPIDRAVKKIRGKKKSGRYATRIILFSTRGKHFTEKEARRLSRYKQLILICGRYEGVDERVAQHIADEELCVGDVILTGGEIPAMSVIDAVSRFIPGVLGTYESLEGISGSHPVYTRPEIYKTWKVPRVLLSGDHKKIEAWRREQEKKD